MQISVTPSVKLSIVTALLLGTIVGCSDSNAKGGADRAAAVPATPSRAELEKRAKSLWEARIKKDWKTAFEFVDPAIAAESSAEKYAEWCNSSEPFLYESYVLHEVAADGRFGWVRVVYSARIRKYEKMPPREAEQWQKWLAIHGKWYPVADERLSKACPEPPAKRNLAAEPRLRARFDESSKLREKKDWPGMMAMTDPGDLEGVEPDAFAKEQERLSVLGQRVEWVQAIGDAGTVYVVYNVKLNDPSMTNMPATDTPLIEHWIQRDGDWYRDLRQKPADPPEASTQPATPLKLTVPGKSEK